MGTAAEAGSAPVVRISVAIVTWCRPNYLRTALEHLARLEYPVHEVVIVDASPESSAGKDPRFPWATRVVFPRGARHMTRARNEALLHVSGAVIAFLDDDAYVRPEWSRNLAAAFRDPTVSAVAGRTCNGEPGEESAGAGQIGCLLSDGRVTGNFAANVRDVVDVDHGIGANMAFRRDVLAELGGFRADFGGVGAPREDTDVFTRVRLLGRRVVFVPGVVVDHVGAPHASGKRFSWRYMFWSRHNHVLLLARNYGLGSHRLRAWLVMSVREALRPPGPGGFWRRRVRGSLWLSALASGLVVSVAKGGLRPRDPRRTDRRGRELTRALAMPPQSDCVPAALRRGA
jgi:GT2 family glycosyltransferase